MILKIDDLLKYSSKLIALKNGTFIKFPLWSVDTETLLGLQIVYVNFPGQHFPWMTTHVHPDGRIEFIHCKPPDSTLLNNMSTFTRHHLQRAVYYCQEVELDYLMYLPQYEGDLPFELINALRTQKSVRPVQIR